MKQENGITYENAIMSHTDFGRFSAFIYNECGITLAPSKKSMLEGRLRRRLKELGLQSFSEYYDYLSSVSGSEKELTDMLNQVTTNKTDFFREPAHFRYLTETVLPELSITRRRILVWSAGCSSGEEPYTLAMILQDFGCHFEIVGTDISTKALEKARLAIYDDEKVAPIPSQFKKKFLAVNKTRTQFRIVPELRQHVRLKRLNFMDSDFGLEPEIDIIFCRNVIIYFDKPTQERLLRHLCKHLAPDGYIFMGHSETLLGMDVPLVQVAPTIYKKRGQACS